MYLTRMYFGRSIPDGGVVTDADWDQFERGVLAALFPGFTITMARGGWRDHTSGKLIHEDSVMVDIIHAGDDDLVVVAARIYKARFRQDAVMAITHTVEHRVL